MNTKPNDYSLLREFNLEQAQNDNGILFFIDYIPPIEVKFKGCTSDLAMIFVEYGSADGPIGKAYYTDELKMKPLCWIDGKPVYKGDKLWYKSKADNTYYKQEAWSITGNRMFDEDYSGFVDVGLLSWDKPPPEPHVHQDLIDAYNKGAKIQCWSTRENVWVNCFHPYWVPDCKYRIKPKEPKKKSGWINLWKTHYNPAGVSTGSTVYPSKEDALAGLDLDGHIGAIEIHWEE